jgi:hypothetical protein
MKLIIRFLLLLIPFHVFCQDGDPGSPPVKDTIPPKVKNSDSTHRDDTISYHLNYAATGIINNTNSLQSYVLNNAFKGSLSKKNSTINLSSSWIYGKQSHILTNNDVTTTLDFNLYGTFPHFYYWGLATYNTSISLLINHQLQTGVGGGYNVLDKKKTFVNVSDGLLYEKGDLYDSLYGGPNGNVFQRDRYQTVRNSFRVLTHWVIHDMYFLDGTCFVQNALSHWNDYIFKFNAAASVKLYKWLNFTVAYTYNRFTRTRSENTLLNFGLTVQR